MRIHQEAKRRGDVYTKHIEWVCPVLGNGGIYVSVMRVPLSNIKEVRLGQKHSSYIKDLWIATLPDKTV